MKGKRRFSAADANAIRVVLRKLRGANRSEQKKLRGNLRSQHGFYITDFDTSGKGFSEADFDALIANGVISVQAHEAPDAVCSSSTKNAKSMIDPNSLTSVAGLRGQGFDGLVTIADLCRGNRDRIPAMPGVYLVLRDCASYPEFLKVGTGGHFKGKDPNVPIARLKDEWVEGAVIVYVGQSGRTLKKRIDELIRFGQGDPVGHRGGRLIWQLPGADRLLVCWKEIADDDPKQFENALIEAFKSAYGNRRPFANLRDST